MADIRIKDLTTTASSTASDDFIAVDGTTNGTRKLSAFSPTFGGNATVTGTLSSAGNLSVTGTSAQVILGQASGSQLTYLIRPAQAGGAIQMVQDSATANRWLSLGISDNVGVYSELMRVAGATGNILIPGTVASTTTSSGALVVGNGTSGGLGVGGSINTGGTLRFHTNANLPGVGSMGISATYGLNMYASTGSSYDFTVFNAAGSSLILNPTGTQNLILPGVITLSSSTASTTTSTGALVVSGGVGVGGSVNIHNNLTLGYASAGDSVLKIIRSSGGNEWLQIAGWSAGSLGNNAYSIDAVNGAGARPVYFRRSTDAGSTYTNFLTWDTSNNATFAGAIAIGNTVTTGVAVASTHKVQISIGGTTYYLLASNV